MPLQGWVDFREKISRYFFFDREETRLLLAYILILGFIIGFNDGSETFSILHWLRNFVNSLVIITLAILVHESAHKIVGLHYGQRVELKFWAPGIILGLLLAVFSNGELVFLVSSSIVVQMMEVARIGRFRYGLSYFDLGVISAAGPLANVALALVLKVFKILPVGALVDKAIFINLLFAIYNMLPIPSLDGAQVMFASRSWYVFTFACIVLITLLLLVTNALLATIGAIILGFIVFMIYFSMVELK